MGDEMPEWQDGPGRAGWKPVVRHAPDRDQYHLPEHDQLRGMRGSMVGRFATIPASRPATDGRSYGFDANVAGPVHVDPEAPDGGVIFDPAEVRQQDLVAAVERSNYPHQAYYQLGRRPSERGGPSREFEDQPRVNPLRPHDYVVPKAASDGRQMNFGGDAPMANNNPLYQVQHMTPVPPLSSLPTLAPPPQVAAPAQMPPPGQHPGQQPAMSPLQPLPQYAQYAPPQMGYAPPPFDHGMHQFMQTVMNGMGQLAASVQQLQANQGVPPTTGLSPVPLPRGRPLTTAPAEAPRGVRPVEDGEYAAESARPIRKKRKKGEDEEDEDDGTQQRSLVTREANRQTTKEYAEAVNGGRDEVIVGFETLGVSWLKGPIADKPRKQVVFTMPTGKQASRYHDVINAGNVVILVFDTRYEEADQFLPMECEKAILIEVPTMKLRQPVMSMGFTASFGCFDLVILVKYNESQEETDVEA